MLAEGVAVEELAEVEPKHQIPPQAKEPEETEEEEEVEEQVMKEMMQEEAEEEEEEAGIKPWVVRTHLNDHRNKCKRHRHKLQYHSSGQQTQQRHNGRRPRLELDDPLHPNY